MARVSPERARGYLEYAKTIGWIFDYERIDASRVMWRIETVPTRYAVYHDADARGEIVLTTREVMAFIEGCWAASKTNPTNRAGAPEGSAVRDFHG